MPYSCLITHNTASNLRNKPKISSYKSLYPATDSNYIPYYWKLALVLIKVFEINANERQIYFIIKEITAKEVLKFENEGN